MTEAHGILIVLMVLAALTGGLASHFGSIGEKEVFWSRSLYSHLLVSGLAAFSTPLFLSLAKSNLISDLIRDFRASASFSADVFVFFGFCLIASFSARVFVGNLTDTVLNLKRDQRRLRSEVNEIEQDVTDLGEEIGAPSTVSEPIPEEVAPLPRIEPMLPPLQFHMLRSLVSRPFTWRSVAGVRKELGLSRGTAEQVLRQLVLSELVDSKPSRAGNPLYRITAAGRAALGLPSLVNLQQSGVADHSNGQLTAHPNQ